MLPSFAIRTIGISLLLSVALMAQTQDTRRPAPPAPTQPNAANPPTTTNPAVTATPDSPGLAVDTHKYVIGAEDVLGVLVWRENDISRVVVVRPDGKISLPMVGEIQAAGLTPEQLGKNLVEALTKYINNPEVLVSVQQVNSKKYYIDGEVGRPGEYRLITPTTVLEALSEAGGFRDFANTKKIRILRGDKTLRFNYKEVSHGKHMDQNIFVESGDHIIVP